MQIAVMKTQARKITDGWLLKQATTSWISTQRYEHARSFIKQVNPAITEQLLRMPKRNVRIITGIVTGHCKLNSHLANMGLRDDPDCDLCGISRETAKHILCECVALASVREQMYGSIVMQPHTICDYPLQKVVDFYEKCSKTYPHFSRAFNT